MDDLYRPLFAEGLPVHIFRCFDCGMKVAWGEAGYPEMYSAYFNARKCPGCYHDFEWQDTFTRCKDCNEWLPEVAVYADGSYQLFSFAPYCIDCAYEQAQYREQYFARIRQSSRHGYVYLLNTQVGIWKIGRSAVPVQRIDMLEVKLPYVFEVDALIETGDMYRLESHLHRKYAAKRLKGEWFRLDMNDVDYIKTLVAAPPWQRKAFDVSDMEDMSWR